MRAQDRSRPPDQDRGDVPRPSRLADVQRDPRSRADGPTGPPGHGAAGPGIPQAFADLVVVVPFNDLAAARQAFEEHRGPGGRHDRRAGDDELRRHPARAGLPAGARGSVSRVRRVPRVRRGEDRRDPRRRRRGRGVRGRARHRVPGQGDRRRHPVRRDRRDRGAVRARRRRRVRHGRARSTATRSRWRRCARPSPRCSPRTRTHARPPRRLPEGAGCRR